MALKERVPKRLRVAALGMSVVLASFAGVVGFGALGASGTLANAQESANVQESPVSSCGPPVVTETVLVATIDALASGDVIAGPGQVCVTQDVSSNDPGFDADFPDRKTVDRQTLWQLDDGTHYPSRPLKHVTLTVQKLGACRLKFDMHDALRADGTLKNSILLGGRHGFVNQSRSISQVRAFRVDYSADIGGDPCLFVWVLRETQPDA